MKIDFSTQELNNIYSKALELQTNGHSIFTCINLKKAAKDLYFGFGTTELANKTTSNTKKMKIQEHEFP